jgi:hypothetical protein
MSVNVRTLALFFTGACCLAGVPVRSLATELKTETVAAYERHLRAREAEAAARLRPERNFLWIDDSPERKKRVRKGEVVVEPSSGDGQINVPGGLIHDWAGAIFIPGATIDMVFAVLNDYNNYKAYYKPTVVDSRLQTRTGNQYTFRLRLKKKAIVTAVVEGDFLTRYSPASPGRWYGRERSTRLVEIENGGTPEEAALPPGKGRGFLWRVDAFTRFQEADGGVYVELEVLVLSRDIPSYVAWFVQPVVRRLSRGSMETSLDDTRNAALKKKRKGGSAGSPFPI